MLRKVEMSHQALTVARLCSPETLSIGGRRSLAAVMVKVGKEPFLHFDHSQLFGKDF
jgi:hypothetical protein